MWRMKKTYSTSVNAGGRKDRHIRKPTHTHRISLAEGDRKDGHIRRHIHHLYLTEGARKSWFHMKNWFLTERTRPNLDEYLRIAFAIHPLQYVSFMPNHDFQAPSAEGNVLTCVMKISMAPLTLIEGRVCTCVFIGNLEKLEPKISIQTIFFLQRFFFFKLKQFVRRCSLIVETYFETIFIFGKKLFEDCILIVNKQPRSRFRPCWRISSGGIVQFIITLKATTKTDVQLLYMTEENRY